MIIGIVGLGLIGGSLAKAVASCTKHRVWALDKDRDVQAQALAMGVIDGELTSAHMEICDVIILALYPADTVRFVRENAARFKKGGVVTDCCGVKSCVCEPLAEIARESGFTFIGAHPMAGIERFGFEHSSEALFRGASMILTPEAGTDEAAIRLLGNLFLGIGFGRIQISTPEEHDSVIAYTSQLAHVLSSAYVKSPAAQQFRGFSAGSFKDMTRVAMLNEDMWTELFFDNESNLLREVDALIDNLTQYRNALRGGDRAEMRRLLVEGKQIKAKLGE